MMLLQLVRKPEWHEEKILQQLTCPPLAGPVTMRPDGRRSGIDDALPLTFFAVPFNWFP